jgi:hypothetical protein
MNLVTFLLIVAILGAIVGALVKGTARTVSLITALLAFVLLVGTPNAQGNASNFFANLFGTGNNRATTQNYSPAAGATQSGATTTAVPQTSGGTGTGSTGSFQGQTGQAGQGGQTGAASGGNLPASPLPGASADNGRSGTTPARSYQAGGGTRTFPSGYTSGSNTRRPRALW